MSRTLSCRLVVEGIDFRRFSFDVLVMERSRRDAQSVENARSVVLMLGAEGLLASSGALCTSTCTLSANALKRNGRSKRT
jgi:hypothetical protein